jgi:hypothetical protein
VSHHIWEYLKSNYSIQKTKNLAEIHAAKYKTILNDLSVVKDPLVYVPNTQLVSRPDPRSAISNREYISAEEQAWLKHELDSFIQSL